MGFVQQAIEIIEMFYVSNSELKELGILNYRQRLILLMKIHTVDDLLAWDAATAPSGPLGPARPTGESAPEPKN